MARPGQGDYIAKESVHLKLKAASETKGEGDGMPA